MTAESNRDYQRIERAIGWVEAHWRDQPSLADVAAQVALSPAHFDRMFTRWAGVSPLRFARFLSKEYALGRLEAGASVLDAALDAGLSGPGRLHDLMVTCEAVTPGEAGNGAAGVRIRYGFANTPFGRCLVATTDRGICRIEFVTDEEDSMITARLHAAWPGANYAEAQSHAEEVARCVFSHTVGSMRVHLRGTNFQIQVWQALMRIPSGELTTYGHIAKAIGSPEACRAVGTAVGANPISVLIPCHRVIRKTGAFGSYRWGAARKLALCGREAAQRFNSGAPDKLACTAAGS